jgi:hypothetical protein
LDHAASSRRPTRLSFQWSWRSSGLRERSKLT